MTEVDLRIPYGNFEKNRSVHLKYHGYDDLYKYNINSDILKNTNWRWLTDDIDYKFNNQGFRCDFDFDDNFDEFVEYMLTNPCDCFECGSYPNFRLIEVETGYIGQVINEVHIRWVDDGFKIMEVEKE